MSGTAAGHDHSTQHLTDVHTRRVAARAGDRGAAIGWDYPGGTLLQVRILRSEAGFATGADDAGAVGEPGADESAATSVASAASRQTVVYDDVTGSFRDSGLSNGRDYFYTLFARQPSSAWVPWGEYRLRPGPEASARQPGKLGGALAALRRLAHRWLPAAVAVTCLAAVASLAAAGTASASGSAVSPKDANSVQAQALAAALADPAVASVVEGTGYQTAVATWGGTQSAPAGATVTFKWPSSSARNVAGLWPLLRSADNGTPVPPYSTVSHRLRIDDLTSLRVDVLLQDRGVIQMLPLEGATDFKLREETWPPFSWFPWFTARPWSLLPLFVIVGAVIVLRAWRRSRAWNRRLPSMTRHDRQFIGRLVVILFLIAGFAWLVYEAIYAAQAPAVDPNGFNAGDLSALPLLLFPPAIFLAALAMELTPAPHRTAWALISVLAGAGSLYNLATAVTGTATNLNLSCFILLGIICLLSAPRAFSAGRMGWSRARVPRYG